MGALHRRHDPDPILTADDLAELPDDGKRRELFEGELVMTPAPSLDHQDIVLTLARILSAHFDDRGLGRVMVAPVDVVLSRVTVLQPDVVVVLADRIGILAERGVHGAPDLVVEVMSPSTSAADRRVKPQLYVHHGVRHYWLVDPRAKQLTEFVAEGRKYRQALVASAPDVVRATFGGGVDVDLGWVFRRVK